MRAITRALLIAGLSAAAWTAWQAADHTAARADDHRPHIVEHVTGHAGQLLDGVKDVASQAKRPDPPTEHTDSATKNHAPPPNRHRHRRPDPPRGNPLGDAVDRAADTVGEAAERIPAAAKHPAPAVEQPADPPASVTQDPADSTPAGSTLVSQPAAAAQLLTPVPERAIAPDAGVGPPVPAPAQILLPGDLGPAPQCGQDDAAILDDDGAEEYVPPNTDHGHRPRHRRHHRPAPPQPTPCDPGGAPTGSAVTAAGTHLSAEPYADLPPTAVRTHLPASRAVGSDPRGAVARARSIAPAPE